MEQSTIATALWRDAGELADGDGLRIDGLGILRGDSFTALPAQPVTGIDAPELVVRTADALHVATEEVRAVLAGDVETAIASAEGRPAPLGTLGLVERRDGRTTFRRSHRAGAAPPGAIDELLAVWRAPADDLDARVTALTRAMAEVRGALSAAEARRLLDELDYDLDAADWERFGGRIVEALPY